MLDENFLLLLFKFHFFEIVTMCAVLLANLFINYFYFDKHQFDRGFAVKSIVTVAIIHFLFQTANSTSETSNMKLMTQLLPNSEIILKKMSHSRMSKDTANDDTYFLNLIQTEKEILKANPQISDIYTLTRTETGKFVFLVDSETDYNRDGDYDDDRESRTQIGEVYENQQELLERAWKGETVYTEHPYEDKWGTWVSVFSPSRDTSGGIHSIIGIDYPANSLVAGILKVQLLVFLVVFCIFTILNVIWASRDHHRIEKNMALQNLNEKIELTKKVDQHQAMLVESSKLASLGQMAGGIAHEINNPLAIIQLKASQVRRLIESDKGNKSTILPFLLEIESTSQRITQIINGLRTFSRDGSKDPLTPWPLDKIISDTISLCGEKFRTKGVKFDVGDCDGIELECRPVQLGQVLLNLLNNSLDAIKDMKEKWVRLEFEQENGLIKISVTDSGPGIPTHIAQKLMNPFFTTKPIGQGTGLGLSISSNIIKNHNGKLRLDSSCPNTRFVIELPLKSISSTKVA